MSCLKPIRIENPKRPLFASDPTFLVVPCGKCPACKIDSRKELSLRVMLESKLYPYNIFFTLTYDELNEPWRDYSDEPDAPRLAPCFSKRDVQLFIKRLRKRLSGNGKSQIRYFIASEYGPRNFRPHYHCIVWNFPEWPISKIHTTIQDCWKLGSVGGVGILNDGGCAYCCKYLLKRQPDEFNILDPNFSLRSRRPAIGYGFFEQRPHLIRWLRETRRKDFALAQDRFFSLPRLFASKIFDDEMLSDIGEKRKAAYLDKVNSKFSRLVDVLGSPAEACDLLRRETEARWLALNRSINRTLKKSKEHE
ncbi:replication initiator protein [Peromfec virus RodF5_15]|uniref:Replication initiator protein n=1 Tax=Peromfec virus RodF5_15 TaxID=2929337 RepID=A0A976N2F6_9VIRU|nr:replication initiator protein [Peromfec virus RodF5_15]